MAYEQAMADMVRRLDALQANERRLIDELAKDRKDAERYRKWRAAFCSERDEEVMHKLADAWEPEAVDAVLDAAPAVDAA